MGRSKSGRNRQPAAAQTDPAVARIILRLQPMLARAIDTIHRRDGSPHRRPDRAGASIWRRGAPRYLPEHSALAVDGIG
jgi:hypothetical protein